MGDYQLFGTQYAMRVWLDPAKLNNFGLTATDVNNALQAQNLQVPRESWAACPPCRDSGCTPPSSVPQRLTNADEFGRVLLKVNTDGSQVRLRDVARIDLGAESYAVHTEYNGRPAAGLAIKLATGRERPGHRQGDPRHHGPAGAVLPARAHSSSIPMTPHRSYGSPSMKS